MLKHVGVLAYDRKSWDGTVDFYSLSKRGTELYETVFVQDADDVRIWAAILRDWKPLKVILEVFSGTRGVKFDQLNALLDLHGCDDHARGFELQGLLFLGQRLGYWRIHHFASTVDIHATGSFLTPRNIIHPDTPFGNLAALDGHLRMLQGEVLWLDKHGSRQHLQLLADNLEQGRHTGARLLTFVKPEESDAFIRRAKRLVEQLEARGLGLQVRFLPHQRLQDIHDRWLGDGARWFNLAALNSILQGSHSEIKGSTFADFDRYWAMAQDVLATEGSAEMVQQAKP